MGSGDSWAEDFDKAKPKVLVVCRNGVVGSVLTEPDAEVFILEWGEISARNKDYVSKIYEQAEQWSPEWREQIIFSELADIAQEMGIEEPAWVDAERKRNLLAELAEIRNI